MKILNFWMVAFMALSLSTTLTSCSDDDEKKEETEMKTLTVDATAYNQWVYVNLKDGKTNNVFVLKCKDGTYAKLQFTDFANADNVKGHVTFNYEYPIK